MSGDLRLRNRQRARGIDLRLLRRVLEDLLAELPETGEFDLTLHLVNARAMARLNETHLSHHGPTDVITLDYQAVQELPFPVGDEVTSLKSFGKKRTGQRLLTSSPAITRRHASDPARSGLTGELFICVDVAVEQACRFRTDWPVELVRYAVHGILHLCGHDDHRPAVRRRMKQAENRWLKKLARRFDLSKLARKRRLAA